MDRRFTVKDFFVFVFLSAILVSLWLGKIQYDSLQSWMMKLDAQNQNAVSDMVRARDDIKNLSRMQDKLIETIANSGGGGVRIDPAQFVGADTVAPYFNGPAGALKFPDFAPGDEFVQSIPSRVKTLTPRVSSDAYAALAQAWVMDSLIDRDPDNPKVRHGVVAEENGWKIEMRKVPFRKGAEGGDLEWEVVDAGSDGAEVREVPVITFKMRKDVHFSDGVAMTAEDVVFSYEFTMNKKIAAARSRAYLNNIARVVALDMYTVEFTFVKPYFEALELAGGLSILAKHFYGKYLDDPEAFNQSKNLLFGSGPFMLKDMATWTTDKDIELIRNPRYWGDIKPWINQIRYTTITNDSAQIAAFRNGEVDIYGARPIEYRDLLADKDLMKGCNNYEYMRPTAGYSYIGWQQKDAQGKDTMFADKRVRQAMTFLADRERIATDVFLDKAIPANGPFHPAGEQWSPNVTGRKYNLEKARALLAEAGWKDSDGDNVLDRDGMVFEFKCMYPTGSEDWEKVAYFLRDNFARAGCKMVLDPLEFSVMIQRLENHQFDAMMLGWTSDFEVDIYQMFHSSGVTPGGDNVCSYINTELDGYMEKARAEMDEAKRMEYWHKCHEILFEDQPYTFLMRQRSLVFINNRFENLRVTKRGLNIAVAGLPIEWYVPLARQKQK